MIEEKFIAILRENHKKYILSRSAIMNSTADILRLSKQSIFAMQRDDVVESKKALKDAESKLTALAKMLKSNPHLQEEGSYKAATEEYIEARFFYDFLQGKKLGPVSYQIGNDEYLAGLADFTGELVRRSVLQATKGNQKEIQRYHDIVEKIVSELSQIHLTSKLRQKFDDSKRNLKRIEEIRYDLEIKRR